MTWDSIKVDNNPDDLENGILNAADYNGIVNHLLKVSKDEGIIDGGNALGD